MFFTKKFFSECFYGDFVLMLIAFAIFFKFISLFKVYIIKTFPICKAKITFSEMIGFFLIIGDEKNLASCCMDITVQRPFILG